MTTVLLVVAAVLAAVVGVLRVVAPLTKTTKDDKVLEYAQDAEAAVDTLVKK